ncbi:hypothetical protein PAMC26510_12825 [Caballeronia sordidicola]|uniref:Uncharacterized protein n=1 Tax=Caballeronia sordidicola TaxID=196367 RepID=A0A242MX60_CABSO|nr:hypothetical protein PAMC26510_12825 [Caballeronia sordidicola]
MDIDVPCTYTIVFSATRQSPDAGSEGEEKGKTWTAWISKS